MDRFSLLPPEILSSIFSYLHTDPPPPLSRRLLPYSRAARLHTVDIVTIKQLVGFVDMLKAIRGAGALVKCFCVGLRETTETVLAFGEGTGLNDLLSAALALMPAVREMQAVDWMSTSFVLSDNAAESLCRSLRSLRISVLLAQINSSDFITYRLALLSRYPTLRAVEIMVLPYDPGSTAAMQFDLFPAQDLDPQPLEMVQISHVESLTLGGPLCDQRVVNVLRAFRGLREVAMYDSFASQHIAPALAALDAASLRSLRLQRLVTTPPPVTLPFQDTDWSRFLHLRELIIGMPIASDSLFSACPTFTSLEELRFGATSNVTVAQARQVLMHRPASLRLLELSNVSGDVGAPITPATLPLVGSWLEAVRVAQADTSEPPVPHFPLLDWRLPAWTEGFTPSEVETLFPLAREVGVELRGSAISALLTTFLLERQIDVWQEQLDGTRTGEDVDDEAREVMCRREFWDALALRYKARLLGTGSVMQQLNGQAA
ncbi:hypothetical protein BMF94_2883 [Rhodotorula taiwanensis]|uniref:F-box domain-containing protein n=1 Tax=Rhodotorula taiwanensis TaxID=741276 RepID=A0A2S5BBG5_9BASI|nr:hypothetical protein BMF94_2883 [Rhodotorula taiwanensis]